MRLCGIRQILLLSMSASVVYVGSALAVRISGDLNEFNGYTLEAPLSRYPGLKLVRSWTTDFVKEVGLYENPHTVPVINGVSFVSARYRFADGSLESIHLNYESRANREKLLSWIEEHYGRLLPVERKMINQVEWHGDHMTITLSYDPGTSQGTLWFISPTLHHLVNKNINDMTE
jgi:hypothetical protein